MALLAGIPQSPTALRPREERGRGGLQGRRRARTQTASWSRRRARSSQRRNFSPRPDEDPRAGNAAARPGQVHRPSADYEAAKTEPVILASQAPDQWRAPHFVWKVREELGEILCGDARSARRSTPAATQVTTTLDYRMQRIVEKWVYAAAIIPNSSNPDTVLKNRGIPRSEWALDQGPRAGTTSTTRRPACMDYRTGEVLAYVGLRVLHRQGQQEVPAPVRRPRPTAGASPGRRSSRSCT